MVTSTLPEELRGVARSNQKTVYNILFRASSQALQKLALDPRFVGGRIGTFKDPLPMTRTGDCYGDPRTDSNSKF